MALTPRQLAQRKLAARASAAKRRRRAQATSTTRRQGKAKPILSTGEGKAALAKLGPKAQRAARSALKVPVSKRTPRQRAAVRALFRNRNTARATTRRRTTARRKTRTTVRRRR